MNGLFVTVQGIVGTDPKRSAWDGQPVLTFRVVSRDRKWNRAAGGFVDGNPSWLSVRCFRDLARNVDESIRKGDRVLVHGRMQVKDYTAGDGSARSSVDVDADAVGPDLQFGTTQFTPNRRPVDAEERLRAQADELDRALDDEPRPTIEELMALQGARAEEGAFDQELDDLDEESDDDELDEPDDEDDEDDEDVDDEDDDEPRGGRGSRPALAGAGR